ncbi:amino acid adenylation domain-containing protein [Pendulispora brunnea]|uniref:Amino acid adenylation domain-containing protein n=1 Tax=Pendulispora brunnea TaxID=2905690 RepID=A0ABZ2KR73_9BACT
MTTSVENRFLEGTDNPSCDGEEALDENLRALVYSAISSITGHRVQDISDELFLEADLGLDSLKRVQLLSAMASVVPAEARERLSEPDILQHMMQALSVAELLAVVGAPSAPPSSVKLHVVPTPTAARAELELADSQYPFLAAHLSGLSHCSLCSTIRVLGPFDARMARAAWDDLLQRHPVLRAKFHVGKDEASLRACTLEWDGALVAPPVRVTDLAGLGSSQRERALTQGRDEALNRHWPLDTWPLHTFSAYRISENEYEIHLANHHLVSDGIGNQILLREFMERYAAHSSGARPEQTESMSPEDYNGLVRRLDGWMDTGEEAALDEYLRKQGSGKFVWNPKGRKLAAASAPIETRAIAHRLSKDLTDRLHAKVRELRIPINSLLVAAYLKTLASLGPVGDPIILQLPTGGRVSPGVDLADTVGCFAQNLALSFARPHEDEGWEELAIRVHHEIVNGIGGGIDRAQVRRAANLTKQPGMMTHGAMSPLAAALVRKSPKSNLFLPYIGRTHLQKRYGTLQVVGYQAATGTNPGAVDNVIEIFDDTLQIVSNYDREFFAEEEVRELQRAFAAQLEHLASSPPVMSISKWRRDPSREDPEAVERVVRIVADVCHRAVGRDELGADLEADLGLDSLERIRVVSQIEATHTGVHARDLLGCRTILEMAGRISPRPSRPSESAVTSRIDMPYLSFVAQARATPDAIAVETVDAKVTYRELDELSNRLAHTLRDRGIGRGALVGVLLAPGIDMLIALMGILKLGAAYVPLDSQHPPARLRAILQRAQLTTLVTQSESAEVLGAFDPGAQVQLLILMDDAAGRAPTGRTAISRARWLEAPCTALETSATPEDLMTVLFTSGSTGEPKGAMLTHAGYMNRLEWMQRAFPIQQGDRIAQRSSYCFDVSVWELFWPLMYGATVCPVDRATVRDPWRLAEWVASARISVMHFVPSLFVEFLNALSETARFPALRWLIFSGEVLPASAVRRWMARFGNSVGLANLYGPTEASIDVTCHVIAESPADNERIPIGKAIDRVFLAVLDESMKRCPPGKPGELWIGGVQIARGYLNDPETTAKSFVRSPFPEAGSELLYRTGDAASEDEDGTIHFHGRLDTQIKIRGFRVELGEIEAAIDSHPQVREVAVLATDRGGGHLQLVAYVSGEPGRIDGRGLRQYAKERLPEYMVPHQIEILDTLPKNANGKIDRKALRSPKAESIAPSNGEQVGLGPAQRWIFNYFDAPYAWFGYVRFRFMQPLDVPLFEKAVNLVSDRHPALRTTFHRANGGWQQRIAPPGAEPIRVVVADTEGKTAAERDARADEILRETCESMRLSRGPLCGVHLLPLGNDFYEILVVAHHLNMDLISNQLVFENVWRTYSQLLANPNYKNDAPAGRTYPDLVRTLEEADREGSLDGHVDFWKEFAAPEARFEVPFDHANGPNSEASSASECFELDESMHRALIQDVKAAHKDRSFYHLLLAPLYRAMAEWAGQSWIVLSHRSHGRDLGDGRTFFDAVGNFAVNFPVGLKVDTSRSWDAAVNDVKSAFERLPMNGVTYDYIADRLPSSAYPDHKITPVRVNYLGNRTMLPNKLFEMDGAHRDQRLAAPDQKRTTLIEVFLSVVNGKLRVEMSYSRNFHTAESIRNIGQRYVALISEMVADTLARLKTPPAPITEVRVAAKKPTANGHASTTTKDGALAGKVAIITGGGRGIGRATALHFARNGARVLLASRTADELREAASEIRGSGGDVDTIAADVSDPEAGERIVQHCVRTFGAVDVLVNNAGITHVAELAESDPKEWRRVTEINLFGAYYCARAVIPHLLARGGGKIINVGSDSSLIGYPLMSAYAASKHALVGLTKSLAEELKLRNIQVNAVCPAFVDTDMAPKAFRASAVPKDDVAGVILFLASSQSAAITGESVRVFGTQDMQWYGSRQMGVLKAAAQRTRS